MITGAAASGGATAPPGRESFLLFALFLLRLELLFALAFLLRERQVQLVAEECTEADHDDCRDDEDRVRESVLERVVAGAEFNHFFHAVLPVERLLGAWEGVTNQELAVILFTVRYFFD